MPQISLYVDKNTLELVEKMAKNSHKSVSKWVSDQLKTSVKNNWPDNFFEYFGVLKHSDFPEIKSLTIHDDIPREPL